MRMPNQYVLRSLVSGCFVTVAVGCMIVAGSRSLQHFDAALVGYTFATLFAMFGITYRFTMWLQRPPTKLYWKRGWQVFFLPQFLARNLVVWGERLIEVFALNRFIWKRGKARWGAHWLIMWGCLIAVAITFPLVLAGFTLKRSQTTWSGTGYTCSVFQPSHFRSTP